MSAGALAGVAAVDVIGGGGHAKVVISAIQAAGGRVGAVFDDGPGRVGTRVLGVEVVGPTEAARGRPGPAVLAIGSNRVRQRLAGLERDWLTVVHPTAWVAPSARLGRGTVVFAGAVVQPEAEIGEHVIINTGASVDHDARVGDHAHVAPGARLGGEVQVGEGTLMGIGSVAIPTVRIGAWSIVGAGAAVVVDLPDAVVAVGVPARVRRELPREAT